MELEPSTFPIRDAVEYCSSLVRERASLHGIALTLELDPRLELINSDELRFKQVVLNLLSNAVKFTPDGGHVAVAARQRGSELELTVTDDGIGISVEDRERIFESFQQGRRGVSREEGTGLGLTLSRRIVSLLGGTLWLESQVGVGSTFGFRLPIGHVAEQQRPREQGDGKHPAIVLIDDDRASLELLTAYLEGLAVRVVRAHDGAEGLAAVRQLTPAAVVLDIRLPGMDGWEVLRQLRADQATRDLPVVVVSILDEKARGLALGADAYLIKPVAKDDLVRALQTVGVLPAPAAPSGSLDPSAGDLPAARRPDR